MSQKIPKCAVPVDGSWTDIEILMEKVEVRVDSRVEWPVDPSDKTRLCAIYLRLIATLSGGGEGIESASSFKDDQLVCGKCSEVLYNVSYSRK